MKFKIAVLALAVLLIVSLSGCAFSVYELTDDEVNTIAAYSAHIISKYNKYMTEGLVVPSETEEDGEEEEKSESSAESSDEPASEAEASQTGESETDESGESAKGNEGKSVESTQTPEEGADDAQDYVSLSEAVGIDGISVNYVDYDVSDSVTESTFFTMEASAGKTYVIINLKVKNTASSASRVSIIGASPRFRLTVNDSTKVLSQTTLLLSDFSTMSENVGAGKSKEKKLIFEVDESAAQDITSLVLDVTLNDNTSKTKLL